MKTNVLPLTRFWKQVHLILEMIKFEHTLFAMPFALIGAFYAANGVPAIKPLLWIIIAMIGARSAAMSFNRYADRFIDAENPRTAMRAIPMGDVTAAQVLVFLFWSVFIFEIACYELNLLCLLLSPTALIIILGYSYAKRFTAFSHLWLGLALGIAPSAAWIAIKGSLSLVPMLITLGVLCWTAGFDVLYSLQDYEFDCSNKLYSIPKKFGIVKSLWIAKLLHLSAVISWCAAGYFLHAGIFYYIGTAIISSLLYVEHTLIKPDDLSKVNTAFFTINGYISVAMLLFSILDLYSRGSFK